MASVGVLYSLAVLLAVISSSQSEFGTEPNLAGKAFVFQLKDGDDKLCFYASFHLTFSISYLGYPNASNTSVTGIMSQEIMLLNNTEVNTTGECGTHETTLELSWKQDDTTFSASFTFTHNNTWEASEISFTFDLDSKLFPNPVDEGKEMSIFTNETHLFGRTFYKDEYFYCEKCKSFTLVNCTNETGNCLSPCPRNGNKTTCSRLDMMSSIIYPGDISEEHASRKLCIEDYIALQELIVPIVVGSILALLLLLIFVAYIIAYCRRRRREGRYQRLGEANY